MGGSKTGGSNPKSDRGITSTATAISNVAGIGLLAPLCPAASR